ncbi:MAG: hypothetical protein JWM55_228 [Acidimicrobiaceae bacterium]|nr:hypothetical protein [Acidimicrobiaceae bacterium]
MNEIYNTNCDECDYVMTDPTLTRYCLDGYVRCIWCYEDTTETCESCESRPAFRLVYFNDRTIPFSLCDTCCE